MEKSAGDCFRKDIGLLTFSTVLAIVVAVVVLGSIVIHKVNWPDSTSWASQETSHHKLRLLPLAVLSNIFLIVSSTDKQ